MPTQLKKLFDQAIVFLDQHDIFYGHGVEVAVDEVLLLFMHVCEVDFETLNGLSSEQLNQQQITLINHILQERVSKKIPMAYLVGFSVFAGLKFIINKNVLIPRSPFVALIDQGFSPWVDLSLSSQVMDLCTGSGCIGLSIAHYFPRTHVDLVDISSSAIDVAAKNIQNLHLKDRACCIKSDLFSSLVTTKHHSYDLIVANPPYVDEEEYRELPKEFTHEPKLALVSDMKGMEIPVKILLEAPTYMSDDGYLFLEVGYNDQVLNQLLPKVEFEWLELSAGGQGICVFNRSDLLKYQSEFKEFLESYV